MDDEFNAAVEKYRQQRLQQTPAAPAPQQATETPEAGIEIPEEATLEVSAETEEGAGFLAEAGRAILGGVRDGAMELGETVQWAGEGIGNTLTGGHDLYWTENDGFEWLDQSEAAARDDIPAWQTRDLIGEEGTLSLPEVAENQTIGGNISRGLVQFLAGYGAIGRAAQLVKGGAVTRAFAVGAATDFAAFDAHEDRLSNLIESVPSLQNPVTAFLAADEDDSILEGKFKNALEGTGLGLASEGVFRLFRSFKKAKKLEQAGKTEEAAEVMNEAAAEIDQMDLFDDVSDPNLRLPDQELDAKRVKDQGKTVQGDTHTTKLREAQKPHKVRPVDTAKLQRQIDLELSFRKDGATLDPDREVEGDLLNFDYMDGDADVKDVMNMMTDDILAYGIKDTTTFDKIAADATNTLAKDLDVGHDVIDRSLARMAGDAQRQQAMVVAAKMKVQSMSAELLRMAQRIDSGDMSDDLVNRYVQLQARTVETMANLKSVITGAAQTTAAGRIRTQDLVTGQELAHADLVAQKASATADPKRIRDTAKAMLLASSSNGRAGVLKVTEGVSTFGGVINEIWINSILSGVKTQSLNLMSNAGQMMLLPTEKTIGALKQGDFQMMREGARAYAGIAYALGDSLKMAGLAFKDGRNFLDPEAAIMEANGIQQGAIRSNSDNALVRGLINGLGTVIRLPSERFLTSGDELFKQINYRSDLYARLYTEAFDRVADGRLKKGEVKNWVSERMKTGFNPDGSARDLESLNYSREATFTNELVKDSIPQKIQNVTRHPVLRMIVPFIRTPTNIMVAAGQRTPVLNRLLKTTKADMAAGGARAARAEGKRLIGGVVWGSALLAASNGLLTGGGPKDPSQRKALMETGWRPYSFVDRKADGSVEYIEYKRLDPFGIFLGIAADVSDMSGHLGDAEMDEIAVMALAAMANNVTNKSYMTGVTQLVEAVQNPEMRMQSYINSYASSMIPYSSLMRDMRKLGDPAMREVRTATDAMMNTIPGLSDDLAPKRSFITGEVINYPKGWGDQMLSPVGEAMGSINPIVAGDWKDDPVLDELAALPAAVSYPARKIDGIELNSHQYSRYLELHGTVRLGRYTLHERLAKVFESERYQRLRQSDDPELDKRVAEVRKWVTKYRDRAKRELRREFPQLNADVRERQRDKRKMVDSSYDALSGLAQP